MIEPLLETRDLCKNFGALQATDHVNISLVPGEIHALIGPNGAGKSTLVKLIMGSEQPSSGSVHFAGADITDLRRPERARAGLGRTFQISSLAMEHTVLQNAVLGALGRSGRVMRFLWPVMSDKALVAQAEQALERVGLADHRGALTGELSHGQRRLLEVAVALTLEPKAFLMDEPMAGLGAEGSARMTEFLDRLRQEAPILLIEHDMDAVFQLADRISVLVYGRVIATGTAAEIRANAAVREAYLGEEDA
ncbi:ABC transporter ATP-binding protein [Aliishimia ponticola]|uniref:ABC transporter ATP-binding protein n=1 Tax=Aliishimia ponticola TaxID=2499833 RepID=A0A4S4NEX4_9RHOB|nr:ABC transporter ATP-binding protein [Aliishimia ponticola]THH38059.1 ABC transporter ATP-binding protein [Aliishimia ponticola]